MPIHDWTRVPAGAFHDFHQDWTIEIRRTLNRGLLPSGYSAVTDLLEKGLEGDANYTRKANRIAIKHELGHVAAFIEVISPANKDNAHAIRSFTAKAIDLLQNGINLLVIDLIPPTPRNPEGIHQVIWRELTERLIAEGPTDKPLSVASYNAGDNLAAYIDPVAVGDVLPDAPLFVAPGWYVNVPLEQTYQASWAEIPPVIRELFQRPPTSF